jgi:hypothetical protein
VNIRSPVIRTTDFIPMLINFTFDHPINWKLIDTSNLKLVVAMLVLHKGNIRSTNYRLMQAMPSLKSYNGFSLPLWVSHPYYICNSAINYEIMV